MGAFLSVVYALACYVLFLGTFLYAVGFVGHLIVPKALDTGPAGPLTDALFVNTLLLGAFAVQHSVMARHGFKRWWTRIVPPALERSTYVLATSLVFALLFWQWRPMTDVVWKVDAALNVFLIQLVFWLGWAIALISTFLISHFELFGLSQVFARVTNRDLQAPRLETPLFYRHVRHPIYAGFLLAFWAAPTMTAGHLMFAIATTGYIVIGIFFEERDLIRQFGDRYRTYREQVGMLIPRAASARRTARETMK
jgi:protein-S-isoprenylcysteine O-methyltransferase Ste14